MSNHSTIQAIETIAQLTDNGLPTFAICLRMTGLPAVWSDPLVGVTAEESAAWQTTIQQVVAPYFEGQSLSAFRPLADQLHQLTETVTITEIVQPSTSAAEGAISRRRLISGLLAEDKPTQPLERVYTETRPLPSTLRYVLSLLLLRSVCTAQHITIRDMLRQEFAWQIDQSLGGFPQLQAAVSDPAVAPLVPELQAIWYTVSPKNTLKQIGENNVHLQQYARQLKEWLAQVTTTTRPQIYLDVRGSLGQLYNNNIGKILGAIFGLEYATKPYPLALVDPIFDEDPLGQRKRLSNLKQYLGFRKLKTEIWVRQTVKGLDEIEPLAQSGGVDGLQIDVLQWETLAKVIEGMQIGRAAGLPLTLILPPHIGPQEATFFYELAAAAQPNYLLLRGSIPQIYNLFKRQHHPAD